MTPDGEFFKYLKDPRRGRAHPPRDARRPGVSTCRDLLAALGLFLVFEGIAPFLNPQRVKRALARIAEVGDRELRIAGLGSMLVGVIILFCVR